LRFAPQTPHDSARIVAGAKQGSGERRRFARVVVNFVESLRDAPCGMRFEMVGSRFSVFRRGAALRAAEKVDFGEF